MVKTLLENNFHNNYFSIYCIDIDKAVTGSSQSTLLQVEVSLPMNLFQFSISYELVVNIFLYDFSDLKCLHVSLIIASLHFPLA